MQIINTLLSALLLTAMLGACNSGKSGNGGNNASPDPDIRGSYDFWPDDANHHGAVFVKVDQSGNTITITPSCANGTVLATGSRTGDQVAFSWSFPGVTTGQTFGFSGTISGNDILLTDEYGKAARLERTLDHVCGMAEGVIVPDDGQNALTTHPTPTTPPSCSTKINNVFWQPMGTVVHSTETGSTTTVPGTLYPQLTCADISTTLSDNKSVQDAATFSTSQFLYPGAVIQGSAFLQGNTVPFSLTRAGGTIVITGVVFDASKSCPSSVHINTVNFATVTEAINGLLNCGVVGTAASMNLKQLEVFSNEQWAFDMNLNANMSTFNVMLAFNIDGMDTKNDEMLSFTQQFYKVSFLPDSGTDFSGFFSDTAACASSDSIRDGNPPLYVSDMTYGRIIMVVASSEHTSQDIKAALSGAYNGLESGGTVSASASLTYKKIMDESAVSYMAYGGGAQHAVQPISASTTTSMFDAVKQMLSNQKAATYAPDNPGLPVAYSVNMVKDESFLTRNLSTKYTGKDCAQKPATETFTMFVDHVADDMYLYVFDTPGNEGEAKEHIGKDAGKEYIVAPPAGTYCIGDDCWKYLEFRLSRTAAIPSFSGAYMQLKHNETIFWDKSFYNPFCFWGDTYNAQFRVNILTGEIIKYHSQGYHEWSGWVIPDW